jgi:hypothetical protein
VAGHPPIVWVLLFIAGMIASAINAVAGGGSLISFPTLTVGLNIASLNANATNSVALWPGSLASLFGFLNLRDKTKDSLRLMFVPTLIGSVVGALLLVATSKRTFDYLVPALILMATVLLAFQPKIKAWAAGRHKQVSPWVGVILQLLVAIYGGYFGAGMGIMMLGAFALTVEGNIHELNALKSFLAVVINLAASVVLFTRGLVVIVPALVLMAGAIVGGYAAAVVSQRVDSEKLRVWIVAYGFAMTGFFVYRALHA